MNQLEERTEDVAVYRCPLCGRYETNRASVHVDPQSAKAMRVIVMDQMCDGCSLDGLATARRLMRYQFPDRYLWWGVTGLYVGSVLWLTWKLS